MFYRSNSTFWLLLNYIVILPFRWLGMPLIYAQRASGLISWMLLTMLLAVCLGPALSKKTGSTVAAAIPTVLIWIGLIICGTLPSFWISLLGFNPEQFYFIPALLFCFLAAADFSGQIGVPRYWLLMLTVAMLGKAQVVSIISELAKRC